MASFERSEDSENCEAVTEMGSSKEKRESILR